nr:orsellinic acid synthase [Quercus suber]
MKAEVKDTSQPLPSKPCSSVPIVLIHDGGGTAFQYFMLPDLDRKLYTISNPYHESSDRPEGGVPTLAQSYIEAMKEALPPGPLILGGWSFGGIISFEIARLLQDDAHLRIQGIVMIDSVCPWSPFYAARGRVRPTFRPTTSEIMKAKVISSFDHALDMIREWPQPEKFPAPPTVLIRATEPMPIENSPDGVQFVRDSDGALGWEEMGFLKMKKIVPCPGNHFSMWKFDKVSFCLTPKPPLVVLAFFARSHVPLPPNEKNRPPANSGRTRTRWKPWAPTSSKPARLSTSAI